MKMTIKEIIKNIEWETGIKINTKKFISAYEEEENKEQILEYGSEEQINFIEKILGDE